MLSSQISRTAKHRLRLASAAQLLAGNGDGLA